MLERLPSRVMTATAILTLDDLGLGQECNLDQASRKLAERSEAQIVRWVQFPAGALFFTLVPDDPDSGAIYVFDRKAGIFYLVDFNDQKWGGHSLAEYETLERACRLTLLARQPRLLRPLSNLRKRAQGTGSPLHLRKF
jgi:hypothetical protein